MKRIFTFALVAFMAITGFANPQEATVSLTKGQAMKQLLQRETLSANMVANKQDAQAASTQTNALDTIELVFKSFYQDPMYIPEEVVISRNGDTVIIGGDWLITLKNDRYQFNFDFYGGTPQSPAGIYTIEDMEVDFSSCFHPGAPNKTSYYQTCNLTIKEERVSANMVKYILDAEIIATLGIGGEVNGAFKVHAEHEVVTANLQYDVALYNCVVTPEEDRFNIAGQDDTISVDLTFFTDLGVVGYYSENLLDTENAKLIHRGTSYEVIELEGIVASAENIYGSITYVAMMEILAESENDTTFFNIAMEAPVIPADTVNVFCNNLILSAQSDAVVIEASNSEYSIYAGYNDNMVRDSASYSGMNAMVYITELETEKIISAMVSQITVVGSKAKGYTVTAKVVGDDHKFYDIYLTNVLPDELDTVYVDFPLNSKAMFDIDELGLIELLIANYNGDYSVSFDILNIDRLLIQEEFTKDDLFIDETEVTSYFVKHTEEGDVPVDLVRVDGTIKQKNDTTFFTATIVGFDATVYNLSFYYTIPTPTETLSYTFTEENTLFTNALPQGIFILNGMTEDGMVISNVQVNRNFTGSVEGTFICDGEFIENQFEPFETYVATYNPETNEYVPHYMQKGEMTVTIDENNILHAQATFICDDAKQYNLTFSVQYERVRLPYDATESGAECTYSPESEIFIEDYVESDNMLFFSILAHDYTSEMSLCFFIDEKDEEIIIPEGVYPIKNMTTPLMLNTVVASRGLTTDGYPLQSYYAEIEEIGGELYYVEGRGFFLVEGTVTVHNVNGHLKLDVDAINSYDLPVKLHYEATKTTDVENVEGEKVNTGAEKRLHNGHLLLIRNGKTYNAIGAIVK